MGRNSITVGEYNWAQKICKHCQLEFEEFPDDPTPEELSLHCNEKSEELTSKLEANAAKMRVIEDPKQLAYFEALRRNAEASLSQANDALGVDDLEKANGRLNEAETLLATIENFVEQIWFPLDSKYLSKLEQYKCYIELSDRNFIETPNKALKREFATRYQSIINLIAETEDLISGQGQAAESAVVRNLDEIKAQILQTDPLNDQAIHDNIQADLHARRLADVHARFPPKRTEGVQQPAPPPQTATDQCEVKQEEVMHRIHELLAQEGRIHDPELQASFDAYSQSAQQINGVINRLLSMGKVDSAKAELTQLTKVEAKLQGCIDQANADNQKRDGQQAGAYRKTLRNAQKKAKQLSALQNKIIDPSVAMEYAGSLEQIDQKISEIGWILASGKEDRLQLAEQALPQLDALMAQTQAMYNEAITSQQREEHLLKQGDVCKANANAIRVEVKGHLKSLKNIGDFRTRAALEAQSQNLNALATEITTTLQTQDPDRVNRAEATLEVLRAEYEQLKADYLAALKAEKLRLKERRRHIIEYGHPARGVRNNVDSRATPSGRNPEFYCEKQKGNLSVKHAINACLGFGAITEEDITNGVYAGTIDSYELQTDDQLYREVESYFPDLTLADMKKELAKDRQGFYRKAAEKHFNWLFDGISPEVYVEQVGADTEIGIAALRAKQKALGLPEPIDTYLEPAYYDDGLQKSLDKVREITADETKDRLVLAYGDHLVALRKNTEGDWFEIDSFEEGAKRVDLEKYIEEKAHVDPRDGLVLLHFDGDLNPPPPQPAQPIRRPRR